MQQSEVGPIRRRFAHQRDEIGINLDAHNSSGGITQASRQATGATAHFEHHILLPQLRGAQQQLEQVKIDQEVLAKLVLGMNTALPEQISKVGERLPTIRRPGLVNLNGLIFHCLIQLTAESAETRRKSGATLCASPRSLRLGLRL